ncbi:glycosyltransferase family 39 protein [uncultured Herbaspirillum sp.]|uniref:glycosyltransferase family 39 protein n=1 Tax=uncultured Herbaspirillum sp. TaxID=160236 RepID=UPI00258F9247|nr:glycosyltransferase family 39 protein [uncultured Herbaspirillum sp.]
MSTLRSRFQVSYYDLLSGTFLVCIALLIGANADVVGMTALGIGMSGLALLMIRFMPVDSDRYSRPILCFLMLSLLAWTILIDSNQISDFGIYFRCGADFAEGASSALDWSKQCESPWIPGFAMYWRRSLLYTLPIGWLSNGSYLILKLANAGFHIAAVVLLYRYVRKELGLRAGIVAAIALCFYPEFWFSSTLATSDNPFIVIEILLIGAIARLCREPKAIWVVCVALLVMVLDLLRSAGPILIIGIILAIPIAHSTRARIYVFIAAITAAFALFASVAVPAHFGMTDLQSNGFIAALASGGISHPRSFTQLYNWNQYVLPDVAPDLRTHLSVGLIAQDLVSAWHTPSYWASKVSTLFQGMGYYFFSSTTTSAAPDDLSIAGAPTLGVNPDMFAVLHGIALVYLVGCAIGIIRMRGNTFAAVALAVGTAFLLFFIGPGEVQPRYSLLLAPLMCIAIATIGTQSKAPTENIKSTLAGMGTIVLLGLAGLMLAQRWATHYVSKSPTLAWKPPAAYSDCIKGNIDISMSQVNVPTQDRECRELTAVPHGIDGKLNFFILREPLVPKWETKNLPVIDIVITVVDRDDVETRVQRKLTAFDRALLVEVPVATDSRYLKFTIRSEGGENSKVSLAYFHDGHRLINNLSP